MRAEVCGLREEEKDEFRQIGYARDVQVPIISPQALRRFLFFVEIV
jgi:hypothetical protein